ncbi:Fanconi anemia group E protein isoform X1 [Rissa tridactyla]|uniref:Fanconi anemia group E protein isoform X1 n=1 Tax=Rissa tridactyla TaxID=75485 RepID=UPI0023BA4574|nr:Fanconi anemia group E protein isoform X1 [Rissa tridactyla]
MCRSSLHPSRCDPRQAVPDFLAGGCEPPPAAMDPSWLQSFDKPCRLLLHTLASGSSGTLAALRMLQRVPRGPGQVFPWQAFTAALCAEEPTLEGPEGALAVKPRLLLLPVMCQRNLFSLLLVVQDVVPGGCLGRLLQAVQQDSQVDPWVRTLRDLLRQGLRGEERSPPPAPLSSACRQQIRCLCQKIAQDKPEGRRKLNWCFSKHPGASGDVADSVLQDGKRKKASEESLELDEEREGKRLLLEEATFEPPGTQEGRNVDAAEVEEETPGEISGDKSAQSPAGAALESSQQDAARDPRKISQAEQATEVQSFLQVHGQRLKVLLQKESNHSELSIPPELHVLNNSSPGQLEGLCSFLQLSTCPEHLLVRFCGWLLALTPDLSYTSATVLAEQLFLRRVLSLTQPPSRHLMAALASFCSKYSQPFCRVLVAAVLREPGEGSEQTKLVCELVEECLEPDSVRLVLSQVLELPLSEKLLPVVQAVLGRQVRGSPLCPPGFLASFSPAGARTGSPSLLVALFQEVLPPELFDLLVLTLCRQAPAFATSLNYAKLVTAVLTMYQSQVTPAHRSRLAAALDWSNAALKKSLQAVLEGAR